jgi:hypothetical protein
MLKSLFSSSTRAEVLSLLLNSPDEMFYIREVAGILRKNPSVIKRELDNLEQSGILRSERVANLRYFQADTESPLYAELKNLITKSLGLPGALRAVLRAAGARAAFIYGPYAEDDEAPEVKLLVMGAQNSPVREFKDLERKFGRTITWIEMEEEEYRAKRRKKDPTLVRILAGKRISLLGRV